MSGALLPGAVDLEANIKVSELRDMSEPSRPAQVKLRTNEVFED